jgi:uncharacterized protein YbjT (DUF2867 family)
MTILVTGARGHIGSRVIDRLAAGGHRVRASARTPGEWSAPPGVEIAQLDLANPGNAAEVLKDVEAIFVYVALGDVSGFMAKAAEAGVGHVVMLSSPASYEPGEHDRLIGQAHRAVEKAIEDAGLGHTLLYPSWLAHNAQRDWGAQIRERGRVGIYCPDSQVNPIHLDDIAEVAAEVLARDHHRARMHVLTGPESLRLREVVEVIAEESGVEVGVDALSREQAMAQREEWMPAEILDALLGAAERGVGMPAPVTNTVQRILGRRPRPLRDWAREHRADFGV